MTRSKKQDDSNTKPDIGGDSTTDVTADSPKLTQASTPPPAVPATTKAAVPQLPIFIDADEAERLTLEEVEELSSLRHRCYTDKPFGRKDMGRMQALEKKAWGE